MENKIKNVLFWFPRINTERIITEDQTKPSQIVCNGCRVAQTIHDAAEAGSFESIIPVCFCLDTLRQANTNLDKENKYNIFRCSTPPHPHQPGTININIRTGGQCPATTVLFLELAIKSCPFRKR